MRMGIEEK